MEWRRRGDQDGVHVLGLDDVLNRGHLGTDLAGQFLGGLRYCVSKIGDLGLTRGSNGPGMYLADATGAQNSKT